MQTISVNAKTCQPEEWGGGCVGQISLPRLLRMVRASGELRPNEDVTHVRFHPDGTMQFKVVTK